jgi:hypothetical protein
MKIEINFRLGSIGFKVNASLKAGIVERMMP